MKPENKHPQTPSGIVVGHFGPSPRGMRPLLDSLRGNRAHMWVIIGALLLGMGASVPVFLATYHATYHSPSTPSASTVPSTPSSDTQGAGMPSTPPASNGQPANSGAGKSGSSTGESSGPAPSGGCSGETVLKTDGNYWQCTFDDEFSGNSLDTSKWAVTQTAKGGYHSGQECFMNSPNNVYEGSGVLNLTVRQEAQPFTCEPNSKKAYTTSYTSGMVNTVNSFAQAYGRFEIRAKVPNIHAKGLQESFWLWPSNEFKYATVWPTTGEIDIAEIYHQYPDRAIPFIHYTAAASDPNVTNNYCYLDISQYHSYVLEWTPSSMTISFDGKTCVTDSWNPASPLTKPAPFDQPFFINLTQALGITTNAFDPSTTPLPATTQVDYVRVWK